jgi:hypothetical protein
MREVSPNRAASVASGQRHPRLHSAVSGLARRGWLVACLLAAAAGVLAIGLERVEALGTVTTLRTPQSFASIADRAKRSRALLSEAGKVITHARCVNCHPAGDSPLQGNGQPHLPSVVRGGDGLGAVGMRCNTCHQTENYAPSRVPGHPKWQVAPIQMAWQARSLGQICEQIKDPGRNGGKTLAQLHEHMAHDTLVGWAWNPGAKRQPAPGTQEQFGALIAAWIETGAECPTP